MSRINTKSLVIITIAVLSFSIGNSQIIRRSSISAIGAVANSDANILTHSIGRMYFANTSMLEPVTLDADSEQTKTTVAEVPVNSIVQFGSLTTYPNPAINNIHFAFELPEAGKVNVAVYNEMSQKLSDPYHSEYNGGKEVYQIDLSTYSPGLYFLSLNFTSAKDGQSHTITQKFQIIR